MNNRKKLTIQATSDKKALKIDGDSPHGCSTLIYDDSGYPLCVLPGQYKKRGIVFRINDRRRQAIHSHAIELLCRGDRHHSLLYSQVSRELPWLRPGQFYDALQKYPDKFTILRGIVSLA